MNKGLLFSCLMLASSVAQATPISLEYQGFYQRLKQVNKGHYPLVDLAFSVPKVNGCIIESGFISTEKNKYPLTISSDQRLFIPFDGQLKSDRALINLQMKDDKRECGVAMQIRAKAVAIQYKQRDLTLLVEQMDQLLKQMQGFPMRYFTDDIMGLSFDIDGETQVFIDGKPETASGIYHLSKAQITALTTLKFAQQPRVVSPWIN